ncbi:arsenical pump-driving ATPase [Bacillus tamaricis]|uniref:Arsenical pump-driving ATPase n=2 Tax=Evansella tamaricis TaxID=2069301 RepID=A0ABS6JGP6_9BACI|nr:arsenical pump-driving ATPase [Evansella tamaricis]MBU9712849.1 arsenical pump-driving ATPase [Evansella tamaricis]
MYPRFTLESDEWTPFIFFTGKGGVGKTSTACAAAVSLADKGKRVLIVSTDPASNLQDVFGVEIPSSIIEIPSVPGLKAINLNPEDAAKAYREKVIDPYRNTFPEPVIVQMEEQLSGACTVEIAAFDEFANLLTKESVVSQFDHILFDTAPTGHTLRLLKLPSAWSGFLKESTHGASCLGPLSGLGEKKSLYEETVAALSNKNRTTLVIVTRPEKGTIQEGARAARELYELGLTNQMVVINGLLERGHTIDDDIANAFTRKQQKVLEGADKLFSGLPLLHLPYVPFALTGIESLREFFNFDGDTMDEKLEEKQVPSLPGLSGMIDQLAQKSHGVIMTMGKGGVGKTTLAASIALGLVQKGKKVHLTTTDPAAHITEVLYHNEFSDLLTVSKIDPEKEVTSYRKEVLETAGKELDGDSLAYLEEDLNSPCTEEIAIFQAFANVVERADGEFVIIDTAPTGHTLLLLDASQSFTKELERTAGDIPSSVKSLLPRLRNREETDVVIVTLPEATPVLEAIRLQDDLERANITPGWWIINQSLAATNTKHPILRKRAITEIKWIERLRGQAENQIALIPWIKEELVGGKALLSIVSKEK